MVFIGTRGSVLVYLEVKVETYRHSTGSQFNITLKNKNGSCLRAPLL
jgi:hypothetical protein